MSSPSIPAQSTADRGDESAGRGRWYLKLRVFVASPQDVIEERRIVLRRIQALNLTGNLADDMGVVLEVLDWHSHVAPLMGRPEQVILTQLPVETWDIFVGILWSRFGTPSGAVHLPTQKSFESGTEEEFALAYSAWEHHRKPHILFYQCTRPPANITDIDPDQFSRVKRFLTRFSPDSEHPGLVKQFKDTHDFEEQLSRDIVQILRQIAPRSPAAPTRPSHVRVEDRVQERIAAELKAGSSYPLTVFSIDIAGHSGLFRRFSAEHVKVTLDSFRHLVCHCVDDYAGGQIDWAADGGLFAFWGDDRCQRAVLASMTILEGLVSFNMDDGRNPLSDPIEVRIAVHDGPVEFTWPTHSISSETLNFVSHLEKQRTRSGEICISDTVFGFLNAKLQRSFSYKSRFGTRTIFVYPAAQRLGHVSGDDVARLLGALRSHVSVLSGLLDGVAENGLTGPDFEAIGSGFDFVYTTIDQFSRWFTTIDERWAPDYFATLERHTAELLAEERRLWEALQHRYAELKQGDRSAEDLRVILQVSGSRRSLLVAELGQLCGQLRRGSAGVPATNLSGMPSVLRELEVDRSDLTRRIDILIEADDLEEESAFAELMVKDRDVLVGELKSDPDSRSEMLAAKLWTMIDLVVLEDYTTEEGSFTRLKENGLVEALRRHPGVGRKYQMMLALLRIASLPVEATVRQVAIGLNIELDEGDISLVWLALLVLHSDDRVCEFCAKAVSLDYVWRLISYPRVPIKTILHIQRRVRSEASDDIRKIFFDCVRGRLLAAVGGASTKREMEEVKQLTFEFFRYDFFVQTEYFERLNELLTRFLKRAEQFELETGSFREIMKRLDKLRVEKNNPAATLPDGIGRIPRAIQRRLAREGLYLDFFVLHPDDRIAKETAPHIKETRLERVLLYKNVNSNLFGELLRRPEVSSNRSLLMRALLHPKCELRFAGQNLGRLGLQELERLSRDHGARREVRQRADEVLMQRRGVAKR